ncbi:nucleolar protein 4-like [Babylonia areolata]|uniref:nucleolar protein 4-like n=1 Tax=Babylonia areolata TaxID=304850 RepID=UPI003FD50444
MTTTLTQTPPEVPDGAGVLSPRNGGVTTPTKSPPTLDKVMAVESKGHPERKRRASNESEDSAITKTSESGLADDLAGSKDEDDDDNEDDDEKGAAGHNYDPERLKAFNMFVRLFVDENLDRSVPISKQPKDKIQAILEACDRQFPEFHERSRKRIRTYLKSCRRMRRSKEQNGWEPHLRPTPPHLTSAAAEGLLAAACENESQNAKRMRMGLEPLPCQKYLISQGLRNLAFWLVMTLKILARACRSVFSVDSGGTDDHLWNLHDSATACNVVWKENVLAVGVERKSLFTIFPLCALFVREDMRCQMRAEASVMNTARELGGAAATLLPNPLPSVTSSAAASTPQPQATPTTPAPSSLLERPSSVVTTDFLRHQPPPPAFRAAPDFPAPFFANGNGLFRPGAFGAFQHPAHHHPAPGVLQPPPALSGSTVSNGDFVPTDLSMKKSSSKSTLSATEVTTIKQLIAGYRESAAFLYRSADELEQLLLQQN